MNKTAQKEIGDAISRAIDLLNPTTLKITNIKLAITELETDLLTIEERLLTASKPAPKPNKNPPK